jgi:predicted RNase H-like HicB family nuclease
MHATDEVFIVDEENNGKSPEWWPCNDTGETIEKALELMPKEDILYQSRRK